MHTLMYNFSPVVLETAKYEKSKSIDKNKNQKNDNENDTKVTKDVFHRDIEEMVI